MKYGYYFEQESVPRWSLQNIDYNSLKVQIKLHTTKNQATAIAIPGQTDVALQRFEDSFYSELERQHDRVALFVSSKADEIVRRLQHLEGQIHSLILRCMGPRSVTARKQRRFAKYQLQILECGDDIRDLERFVHAQVVAFRKILKKYKKWTGSTSLGSRFGENVLGDYKSFTKRDFEPLQDRYREVLTTLQAASPELRTPSITGTVRSEERSSSRQRGSRRASLPPAPVEPQQQPQPIRYYNEYDDGSEAGEGDTYGIYVNPDESGFFPDLSRLSDFIMTPFKTISGVFSKRRNGERQPLLAATSDTRTDYSGVRSHTTDHDNSVTEDEETSSVEYPSYGFVAHYAALPSLETQRVSLYREKVLHRTMLAAFAISAILLVIAGILVATGRHKLRIEVDAGVILAVVSSLFSGCMGIGAMLYREDQLGCTYHFVIWTSFAAVCVLNGALLVIVVGSNVTPGL